MEAFNFGSSNIIYQVLLSKGDHIIYSSEIPVMIKEATIKIEPLNKSEKIPTLIFNDSAPIQYFNSLFGKSIGERHYEGVTNHSSYIAIMNDSHVHFSNVAFKSN
jgi:hypothetical protein